MEIGLTWGEFFTITTPPAITPEEDLRLGAQIIQEEAKGSSLDLTQVLNRAEITECIA